MRIILVGRRGKGSGRKMLQRGGGIYYIIWVRGAEHLAEIGA